MLKEIYTTGDEMIDMLLYTSIAIFLLGVFIFLGMPIILHLLGMEYLQPLY